MLLRINVLLFDLDVAPGMAGSSYIGVLHSVTTLLGTYVCGSDSGFPRRQHIAVNFCLVFCFITEFEFYHAYTKFKKCDTNLDCLKNVPFANVDPSFLYRREPFYYMTDLPDSWRRCFDEDNDTRTF
jgi:hypothetical protein